VAFLSHFYLILFLTIILIIIEISTLILQSTGLSRDIARFQAISLLTGTGFTTKEAELITAHPLRRRVGEGLILFGHLSFAIIIALLIDSLNKEMMNYQLVLGLAILILCSLSLRIKRIRQWILNKLSKNNEPISTLQEVFQLKAEECVLEIKLDHRHQELFKTLRQLNLATLFDIHIVTVLRVKEDGEKRVEQLFKYPTGHFCLQNEDKLTLFGPKKNIEKVFKISLN